ncbi:dolichyl-phosphate beta-glucosyltransferase [Capronia coronata CBS 617.96]|uniref:dolichyl-phosphate beta-glucosyltransferase n=1 Tax=Capronia coronata CBS 617.96 TaxID=1182541 RepID=W9XIY3_9EURO|nr:dolichyl-phosphate beta-glucosyltransferase [Capronia coronata CBS 617.96]EXJ80462.1 dolichyl-phosphate beta-glucosyltransferase [Capronia coronata CBS 617.96]
MGVMGGHFVDLYPRDGFFKWRLVPFVLIWAAFTIVLVIWLFITLFVPNPRKARPSEKKYTTVDKTGQVTTPEPLPCWYDDILRKYIKAKQEDKPIDLEKEIEPPELFMTLVVPAFNEEDRLTGMLEEAVNFLETEYGSSAAGEIQEKADTTATTTTTSTSSEKVVEANLNNKPTARRRQANGTNTKNSSSSSPPPLRGWEILVIDDGSTDRTVQTVQTFSRTHILPKHPRRLSGPWTHRSDTGVKIPPGSIRLVSLEENRGKGGAVTHGMRHARGQYVVFADADGASKFSDLTKLVTACQEIEDDLGRGVAVGSRAHLVGSEAVVKRSKLRNFLMHSFHFLLKLMTPPQTARIKDTQCGFKLFSRPTLPYIVPHMHMDGWIFDVEMLMLAEFAGVPVVEVAVGWKEVFGSKLNVIRDSVAMAFGLAVLRICWGTGIYRR